MRSKITNYELGITLNCVSVEMRFVRSTKQTALRAETQTRLCESERRKTSNCLSRRRVFDVQRTSTRSGSARYVQPWLCRLSESRAELVRAMPSVGTAVRSFFCILFLCQDKKSMWVWAKPNTKYSINRTVGAAPTPQYPTPKTSMKQLNVYTIKQKNNYLCILISF